jgi:hypothetical protein
MSNEQLSQLVDFGLMLLALVVTVLGGKDVLKRGEDRRRYIRAKLDAIGKGNAPPEPTTNGNGNGNGHTIHILSQSLGLEASAREGLEKRMEDFMERVENWREEDLIRFRNSEDSWLRAYKDQNKEKQAMHDHLEKLAKTNELYAATLRRVDETLTDHGNQIIDIRTRNEHADTVMQEILTVVKAIKDKAA